MKGGQWEPDMAEVAIAVLQWLLACRTFALLARDTLGTIT